MKKGYIYIALATVLFSTMEIALKEVATDFNPIQLTLARFLIGGIFLIPFAIRALKKRGVQVKRQSLGYFALLGLIGVVISMIFYQLAVNHAPASVVAVLFSSNTVFVMVFAFLLIREPIYRRNLLSLALELIGIVVIINPTHIKLSLTGLLFTAVATVAFALYGVLGKKKCQEYGGLPVTCISFLFGAGELLVLTLLGKIGFISQFLTAHGAGLFASVPLLSGFSWGNIATFLYICLGVTGAGYAFYFMAMEETSANTASLTFFFKPALAPILALIILHEIIPVNMIVGILLILVGSMASILPSLLPSVETVEDKVSKELDQEVLDPVQLDRLKEKERERLKKLHEGSC